MDDMLSGEPSNHGSHEGDSKVSQDKPEEGGRGWYFSRKEIEENSPSRKDGIDLKKETYLRKSYCTHLQDLGMRLKVPQVTIATAITFCHRFFLRQSHARNDRRTIATVCMFLAGKVEETPRPLRDVILVSYEIIHKKDAAAVQRIKQKEVYEKQKELILLGERVVLATLGFDLNVQHPYRPLVEAIKKFKDAQNALAKVAWNFVNDGLRTSLCLQFKPHHIAAAAIFLAAKFLKVKLPSDGEKVWWQDFDVTPHQLEEVSNQMLELYEQSRPSQASEAEGRAGGSQRPPSKGSRGNAEHPANISSSHDGSASRGASLKPTPTRLVADQPHADNHRGPPKVTQTQSSDCGISETNSNIYHRGDDEISGRQQHERQALTHQANLEEIQNTPMFRIEGHGEDDQEGNSREIQARDIVEQKDKYHGRNLSHRSDTFGQSLQDAKTKLDKEKLKATFERRKARGDITHKMGPVDELERELEDVQLLDVNEQIKHERKQSESISSNRAGCDNSPMKHENEAGDGHYQDVKKLSHGNDFDAVEEGEVEPSDDTERGYQSPSPSIRQKKAGSLQTSEEKAME
ncbi:cyclin-T1-3 isoform X1 [Sesamum indicum]|uniref:Cyclin-T1-3 isoform X1 n=2 Tax=Sesamum indicum TaxID=4182 RepID=A0A6I9U5Q5_SESIN|nr:cyclin-T1-3 isoform X1 [Sesamum indicum]XP_011089126.1 cyclin-T1-3 isoform X1 [Sesamum indicum]